MTVILLEPVSFSGIERDLKERGFEDIFSKENVYDFEKKVFFLLKEEVCYLFFNVLL